MTTFREVITAAIPDADDDVVDHVMWGRTPYPFKRLSAREVYRAASSWRRACDHNIRLCDHCENRAVPGQWECERCAAARARARAA